MSTFPATRLRRLRRTGALRDLVRETTLSLDDLVMPLFVAPEALPNEPLPAMSRHTVEGVVREGEDLLRAGVKSVILFGIPEEKDDEGSGAWVADGIVQQSLRALRRRFPELLLLTDVCLCEYTAHGHCGVLRDGEVDNDASLELLARTAVSHVEAGADAVCPSDMMDGRVAAIRAELPETPIVSYAAKYASAFYGPFREAAGSAPSFGDRRGYQMDPGNVREALRECELDVAEGADVLLVKPALPVPRRDPRGSRAIRPPRRGLQRLRRVRHGEGRRRRRAPRRADCGTGVADRDPPRRGRDRDHLLGEGALRLALDRSELWYRAQKLIPGGVNSPVRAMRAVGVAEPFFVVRGKGAYVETTDGRRLLDWVQSWGPLIFGHADPETVEAVQEAAASGTSFGAPTEREVELAAEIVDAVPSIDQVRLVSSGTEAAMSALRLARAFTARDRVIKFAGGYHGHGDAFLAEAGSGLATLGIPASPGVPEAVAAGTIVVDYNDIDGVAVAAERWSEDLAAIFVEPVAGNMGCVPPVPGFLDALRSLCDAAGALLVFDEVITGFRVARGGAQQRYGVAPDLTILGKIVGGGLPLAAFGGRAEIMSRLAPVGDVYQAGTLSGNPLATAAGLSVLRRLRDPAVYDELELRGARLEAGLSPYGLVQRVGAMLTLFARGTEPLTGVTRMRRLESERYAALFRHLLAAGIFVAPSQYECLFPSLAHGADEIDATIDAVASFLTDLSER